MSNAREPLVEPVQTSYARLLGVAVLTGFLLLFAAFAIYATGALESSTPIDQVPQLWHLSAAEFAGETSRQLGWKWVRQIQEGDQVAFAALVYFPAATLFLILVAGVLYARQRVTSYAVIAFLEGAVLLVAATGVLSAGH